MELLTLATTAFAIATPFLKSTSDGIARKAGEDIWTLIKKPFAKKGIENVEELAKSDETVFISQLKEFLEQNDEFAKTIEESVVLSQKLINNNVNQTVTNIGNVEKQVNASIINGTINL